MNSVAVSYLANKFLNGTAFEVCERNSRTYDGNSDVLIRSFCYIIMDQKANSSPSSYYFKVSDISLRDHCFSVPIGVGQEISITWILGML